MAISTYTLVLQWAKMISPSVRHLAFAREDGQPVKLIPGQFITVVFDYENHTMRRSYSLATIPGQSSLYEIAVGFVPEGPGTNLLFNLQPGEKIQAFGPVGKLVLLEHEQPAQYILVATGTGVTPYRTMLPELARRLETENLHVIFLFGVQSREHLLYGEEFLAFAQKYPEFEFVACYSREFPEQPHAFERKGYVQNHLDNFKLDPQCDIVYLCGNPNMIDEIFPRLVEKGFPTQNIRREKYISSK